MSLYDHFRVDERPFVDRVTEWAFLAGERHHPRLTDFLDPRQVFIVQALVARQPDVNVSFFGGPEGAERVRALIHPDFWQPEQEDYQIAILQIKGEHPQPFSTLDHRDFLGAILGMGLKREKFGDLLFDHHQCQLIAAKEISDYICLHLRQVGRVAVSANVILSEQMISHNQQYQPITITVSTARLDAIVSQVLRISRSKVLPLVRNGMMKVNWKTVNAPDYRLEPGDVVSARGFGRFRMVAVEGMTRKERLVIKIEKYM